ncbi:hypothetical protein [Streptomyces sp. KAI-27]|uniref:hypothetical protein n=1 Tax=Streptomyces sp. KAI-27 TaxID=1169748 RepID=UPI001587566C|nr:hypothetical protein [Streptomyces sp. KAI-27]
MPSTTEIPAARLAAAIAGVLGTDWTVPHAPDSPVAFTSEAADLDLTLRPDRKHGRLNCPRPRRTTSTTAGSRSTPPT